MANIVEMPKLGFDMAEGTLAAWVKSEKDKIEKGEVIAEIETDKATVEVESAYSGVVYKQLAQEGDALPVGTPIAVIAQEGEDVDLDALTQTKASPDESSDNDTAEIDKAPKKETIVKKSVDEKSGRVLISPIAKLLALEAGIQLESIAGSGPGGRIVKRDVEAAIQKPRQKTGIAQTQTEIVAKQDETIEISKLRAAIGRRMTESRQTIPHFYITRNFDVAELLKTRKQLNAEVPENERVSVNDLIVRAAALALRDFPNLNASLTGTQLTRHGDINIGVAVAVENGLLTVVVKNADQKPLMQISREAKEMINNVKQGKVRPEDIEGSTFTISNLGMFDVEDFVAIVNPPEAAILAVGSAKEVPVAINGELAIGTCMKATISADHRITDGAEAARFMQHLGLFLEQPWRLFA